MSHNHLTELPPDVFCLPALEYLNASHNKLVHLARDQTQDDDSNDLEMIPSHNSSLSGGLSQWYTPGDDLGECISKMSVKSRILFSKYKVSL